MRHGGGGQILARNGLALAEAQALLRQAYGASIVFGTTSAHRVIDPASATVLVPMMCLRIDAPRACRQVLLQILERRSVGPGEMARERDRIVLRIEAPLACVIGLEQEVLQATAGAAHILCWLARYSAAPSTQAGPAGAAASWRPSPPASSR